jgi:hypothetical protein
MSNALASNLERAERRAAPKPARIPWATKGPVPGLGDRPTYSSDEGLS